MEVVYPRCCGLDVHKKRVTACVLISEAGGRLRKHVRRFGTMLADLEELGVWLGGYQVTHVAMESTGVYWRPVWNVLEGRFEMLLVNAQHIKNVPGRKTDMTDSIWIAELLRHGLLRGSYVPDPEQRAVRELTRYRTTLIEDRTAEVNRLQKTLEGANIKLASVASEVLGVSGRRMLEALVAGSTEVDELAELARGKLRTKMPALRRALHGRFKAHHQFVVAQHLAHIDYLDEAIAELDAEIAERLRPFQEVITRLDAIPGVGQRIAEVILAEVGPDVSRFASAAHLASWAGMCPGNNESAGKHRSGKTRKGNRYLRAMLAEAAQAAGRTKDTYLRAQLHRLAGRRGKKKAVVAVGHTILVIVYHLLKDPGSVYSDLGVHYFEERKREIVERRLVQGLENLGYRVELTPAVA